VPASRSVAGLAVLVVVSGSVVATCVVALEVVVGSKKALEALAVPVGKMVVL